MAILSWAGAGNLDLGQLGETFDFRFDVLQISNPDLQAHQFDLVEVGTELAIVLSRDVDGAPLAAADVTYAYLPNMIIRQIGVDAHGASQNIVMSNGGQLWVGGRDTDTLLDNQANAIDLASTSDSTQVLGLGGDDTIDTGSGNDRVYGNVGSDGIDGGSGNDSLYGGQDSDTVAGGAGNDNVAGDLGADSLYGGAGNDILYGGAANDTIETSTGNDTVFAGAGDDDLDINDSATGDKLVYMDKGQDYVQILSTTGDHTVYLGENNDLASLIFNAGDQQVFGEGGNDSIESQNLNSDTLDGGDDDDVLVVLDGSIGDKTLIGGDGSDVFYIVDASGNAAADLQPNTSTGVSGDGGDDMVLYLRGLFIEDENDGGAGADTIAFEGTTELALRDLSIQNFETVIFANFDNHVVFADGNNSNGVTVFGSIGDDMFDASAESSAAYMMDGRFGADTLTGGAGDDTLDGGEDFMVDVLNGNDGADTYRIHGPWEDLNIDSVVLEADDSIVFHSDEFDGISAINSPFEGGSQGAIDAWLGDTNLYIITGEDYTGIPDVFANFFTDDTGIGDISDVVDHPILFAFFNDTTDRAEVWFVDWTESWDGTAGVAPDQAQLVVVIDNIESGSQMAGLDAGQFGFY